MSLTIPTQRLLLAAAVILWLCASGTGLLLLASYANSPGATSHAPPRWPPESRIGRSESGPTLVLFAHPHCPCTRATLGELEKIIAHGRGAVTPWIVFFEPDDVENDWHESDLWSTAAAIPGAQVYRDIAGTEAHRFGAMTSGQTLLYDEQGNLVFEGGITAARGHAGDNAGESALESYLTEGTPIDQHPPVFGCPIVDQPAAPRGNP